MTPDRRDFLKRSAAIVSAVMLADGTDALGADEGSGVSVPRRALDPDLLRATGEAVLPESLDPEGREDAVRAFELWWEAFEPNAELMHPYGGWVIPHGPPDREPEWSRQLAALEREAVARLGTPFAEATIEARRQILAEQVTDAGPEFPLPAYAEHVAVALLAHYYRSGDARNRCYGARIDPLTCRSTATVSALPPALGEPPP